jgi:uncharacterized membrane protein
MPVAILPPQAVDPEFCVVSRWKLSLPARTRWGVFALLATISLTLAFGFVAAGAWVVLPYSVLELSVLAFAFRYLERRAMDWERLTVAGDRVIVERWVRGVRERREWNRPWVRAELTQAESGAREQLLVCCAGERLPFGDALPDEERSAVARELRRLTSAGARAA